MNLLKTRLLANLIYFFSWVAYFFIGRFIFLAFYFERTSELDFFSILKTFVYGIRLDMSFTAYLCAIPFLLVLLSVFISKKYIKKILKAYTFVVLPIITLLLLIDTVLYASWGVRLDGTLLNYINTPKVMLASVSASLLFFGILIWLLLSAFFIYLANKIINHITKDFSTGKYVHAAGLFLAIGFLIIPLRGGFQEIPINQSNVYFSKNMFANHAAVNFAWNFGNDVARGIGKRNPFKKFDPKIASEVISKRREALISKSKDSILKTNKPNVILLVWESLSAKVVEAVGGEPNVTENLNKLAKEGILFTNFYGNGDRTDKGIIAILSGYYPQFKYSIIKMPNKTRSLPKLPLEMKKLGYHTSYYYGGDTNFGNMNTYIRMSDMDYIVDGSEFAREDWNSKWGAHDHIFLERLASDLSKPQKEPFFVTALTLTSHEPFEFPDEYKFGKDGDDNLYRSAQAYTDKAIGNFVDFAKKQPWWDNTLIVIMSDHGNRLPEHEGYFNSPKKFKIPMVWLGGALKETGKEINTLSGQTDFAYTLLQLLDGDYEKFKWGKNIFNNSKNQYVHYIFNKGFGTITPEGTYVYDFVGNKPVVKEGNIAKLDSLGRSLSQDSYQDFIDRR
ncbi:alkaline phosphatase family protein [uncultured Tenacibaculum sp.]|uniref:LTA synthase family protein n=1 Tax=uncultured Tenacibaculum sp. TaxID=174713 RepID=UPI00260E2735|nr:alkaline phosphatase family protein [uncultured Tenacibaculum sp.]